MIRNSFFRPTVIFFYHRVEKVNDDPHLLSVDPKNFEKQLLYLQDNFKIIRLMELVKNLKDGKLIRGSAVITFDDGYVDNLTNALPILEKLKIPATVFVTAGKIGSSGPFYWDEKTNKKDQGRAMTMAELKEFAKNPLIEIGAHTMTHPNLATLTVEKQRYEIAESKKILENIIGTSITSFSYPFGGRGDFNDETMKMAEQAGFNVACATIIGNVKNSSSLFAVPRRIVRNWDISTFRNYIKSL
jgi:peptidoglycan/xylan/chitin deacetylase (PgdA/CDA1 family)